MAASGNSSNNTPSLSINGGGRRLLRARDAAPQAADAATDPGAREPGALPERDAGGAGGTSLTSMTRGRGLMQAADGRKPIVANTETLDDFRCVLA